MLSPNNNPAARLFIQVFAAMSIFGGIASLLDLEKKLSSHNDKPTPYIVDHSGGQRRLLRIVDPKTIEPRQPGPPLAIDSPPQLDSSLIQMVFNGRNDEAKGALVNMWTMTAIPHREFAQQAVRRINENGIIGDIVECGVWMGGMTMLMVFENMKSDTSRHFWLFDTFDGLPEPESDKDDPGAKQVYKDLKNGVQSKRIVSGTKKGTMLDGKWNYGPIDVVRNNLWYTGYPRENFHFVEGKVEDTLPVTPLPDKIAILRLDTDWYLSTKAELEHMYGRLQSGGVLIVDDYCTWAGATNAVKEFFQEKLGLNADQIKKESEYPCLVYWKP